MARRRTEKLQEVLEMAEAEDLCQDVIHTEEARRYRRHRDGIENMRCANVAKYVVGGKRLCGKHASGHALELMLLSDKASRINPPNRPAFSELHSELAALRLEVNKLRDQSGLPPRKFVE